MAPQDPAERIAFLEAQLAGERKNLAGFLEARDANLRRALAAEKALRDIEPFLDAIVCFASTMQEHEPNRIAITVRHILKAAN